MLWGRRRVLPSCPTGVTPRELSWALSETERWVRRTCGLIQIQACSLTLHDNSRASKFRGSISQKGASGEKHHSLLEAFLEEPHWSLMGAGDWIDGWPFPLIRCQGAAAKQRVRVRMKWALIRKVLFLDACFCSANAEHVK